MIHLIFQRSGRRPNSFLGASTLRTQGRFGVMAGLLLAGLGVAGSARAEEPAAAPAVEAAVTAPVQAAPSAIVQLVIEPGAMDAPLSLRGVTARQQVLVTGMTASGRAIDLTRSAQLVLEPAGIATIDATGHMLPVANGQATLTATADGVTATRVVTVTEMDGDKPIHFGNQVVPIFTKLACNGGGCHGKASGQNGFKLSLLGFVPEDDYEFLVREARGRRLFPTSADESLLLTKGIGAVPHGGGKRLEKDSHEYRLIARWIEQGMPPGDPQAPVVTSIRCEPSSRVMERRGTQQICVTAVYSDGSTEDVTRSALFEPNEAELAEVSTTGLVTTRELAGEVAIMARYQGQVAVFRATIPLGAQIVERPPVKNAIDAAVFGKLDVLGIPASPVADDATFLRRVSIDLTGTLPTEKDVADFLANPSPTKRDDLVNRLLDSPEYADYFASKWNAILRNKRRAADSQTATYAFQRWIWNSIYDNKPYDQFVREILTASGDADEHPPVAWYREVDQPNEQVEDVSQLFLGLRLQCARCHHHPFEKWSQDDYYGMAAFFSKVGRKAIPMKNPQERDRRLFATEGAPAARNERTGKMLPPTGLGTAPSTVGVEEDPRTYLADWMTAPGNPFFAKSLVNRYWKHFFSRGIVEPEDDMRETNPPANPVLLEALADSFVKSNYDLKQLCRTICQSSTYQLSAEPNQYNVKDKQNFSRFYPKRLTAEVLYDGFHQVTATSQGYGGLPAGTRAIQLPDPQVGPYFLKVFGQPQSDTACECERSQEANLAQSLHLLNSSEVQNKISDGNGRAALLAADATRDHEQKVRELYRWVYSREPAADELAIAVAHLTAQKDNPRLAYEDILWALINTKEFLFNH